MDDVTLRNVARTRAIVGRRLAEGLAFAAIATVGAAVALVRTSGSDSSYLCTPPRDATPRMLCDDHHFGLFVAVIMVAAAAVAGAITAVWFLRVPGDNQSRSVLALIVGMLIVLLAWWFGVSALSMPPAGA